MTSQKDQIQRLISKIESVLAKPATHLPLGLSGEAERQRRLLGELCKYLQSLQQMFDSPGGWGPIDPGTGQFVSSSPVGPDVEESAAHVLQGLLIEMRYLRENSLKPMREELESLQQKRDRLQAEINVLEARGAAPLQSDQQISDFLETLMQRLQEQLSAQMVQNFAAMEAAAVEQLSAADNPAPLLSGQRLEQVRLLQAQSDQLLLQLDSTLTAVFGSLRKSVDSYRESLEEGLDQMHGLGRQGEVIFHAFINHLAQQLGQDASSFLTGDLAAVQQGALEDLGDGSTEVDLGAVQRDELDQALEDLALEADAGDTDTDPILAFDPDIALLEDEIAIENPPEDLSEVENPPEDLSEEDITLIQPDGDLEVVDADIALLEDAIAADEDITVIQPGDGPILDLEEDAIAGDGPILDLEEDAIAADEDITVIQPGDGPILDLDEEITVIQPDGASDIEAEIEADLALLEDEISGSADIDDLAADAIEDLLDDGAADSEIVLDLEAADVAFSQPLGVIDEGLGLLATGAEAESVGLDAVSDADVLPQIESEGELFNLDANLDLGLDSQELAGTLGEAFLPEEVPDADHESDAGEPAWADVLEDANQVADSWLFDQDLATAADDAVISPLDGSPELLGGEAAALSDLEEPEPLPEATVETLFGESISTSSDTDDEGLDSRDTVVSLSEILPDEQNPAADEDFLDNVPDDVYIPASADEDLINLVESGTEQRLLIDFDDTQLVEQLDEDLQQLAGDTFADDYGVEEDDALEPLDQATLETIANDLNLEDLSLDDESDSQAGVSEESGTEVVESEIGAAILETPGAVDEETAAFDLFEGFATDSVDVDDPSANELAEIATPSETDAEPQGLDLLGLGTEPPMDEFDDGLPDSLADELGALSERSNAISLEVTEAVHQADLEEPVVVEDGTLEVPAVEETEPRLDSALMPDLPSGPPQLDAESPESEDFLQEEQAAFWQTMADDEAALTPDGVQTSDQSPDPDDVLNELAASSDMALDAASVAAADDLDDFLLLDSLSPPGLESTEEEDINLADLDDLFGQSSAPALEELDQSTQPRADDRPDVDPLTELGLGETANFASQEDVEIEMLLPQVPDVEEPSTLPTAEPTIEIPELTPDDESEAATVLAPSPVGLPMPPASGTLPPSALDVEGSWFLGLDVGATGLSAVLMNRQTGQVYPLYWQTATEETKHFRLPAMAVMISAQDTVAVGYDALGDLESLLDAAGSDTPELIGVNRLKPLLKVAVGHGQTLPTSEPWLRWSDTVELPMLQVVQAMVALLKYLVDRGQVVGLDGDSLTQVWQSLQGVVVGYPTNWPDTYSFNLREAVMAAGLIGQPEQILFVEDAIATILSGLPDPHEVSISETVSLSRQPSLYNCQWQEGTVVISGGAVMTELGLVNLPNDLTNLNYADFALRGFAYAGDALDQDIVCQLLLPEERRQPLTDADMSINWDWQGHLEAEDVDWSQLRLDDLTLPAVGHVDWAQRYRLQQRLLGSSLGQSLLAAARHLKLALQQQNQVQITLAGQRWSIKRRHLENLIFLPYIQRINRYLNVLLSHHAVDAQAIKQVVCTGGSASLPAIARWLRQKFPNATIIQDTYASELPQSCSRVAYGLVNVARYPQVLNVTRQQYSDYFLLMELLRVFPKQPLPVGAIMHLLEQRGVNTQACQLHILALLEGHLPPGLVPTAADRGLICDRTTDLPTYRALLKTPLFTKTVTESGGQMYIPNEAQAEQLRAYINRLLIDKAQTLEEPLIAHLEALV